MDDPVFIEAMVLGLTCVVASAVPVGAGLLFAAWLDRREARRANGGRRD